MQKKVLQPHTHLPLPQ